MLENYVGPTTNGILWFYKVLEERGKRIVLDFVHEGGLGIKPYSELLT